jgi:hypothetical protein
MNRLKKKAYIKHRWTVNRVKRSFLKTVAITIFHNALTFTLYAPILHIYYGFYNIHNF